MQQAKTYQTQSRNSIGWRDVAFVIGGALLLAASAQIKVPFFPVPMTMQTMVVLGLGLMGGWRYGVSTVVSYLAMGAAGLPVFASGAAGPIVLMGPTGGYLLGFIIAAAFCGLAKNKGWTHTILGSIAVALLGAAMIYATGLLQLGTVIGWDKPILSLGLYPFILGDIVKALIAGLGTVAITRSFLTKD